VNFKIDILCSPPVAEQFTKICCAKDNAHCWILIYCVVSYNQFYSRLCLV
jgi:hypothetical protein